MRDSGDNSNTIALIGAGEMGAAVGRRLRECGARILTSVDGRSKASLERVREAKVELVTDDDHLVHDAHLVLSIVPPGVAVQIAERLRDPIRRARSQPAFVECNAISPNTTRRIEAILEPITFIDAGIIGGPPHTGTQDPSKGPRFYLSGPQAHQAAILGTYGLDVVVLDGPIGAASGLKLAYAGLTKGFTALAAAMVNAAARDGLADALRVELGRTQPALLTRLDRFVPQMFHKAYRWVAEMEQIAEFAGSPKEGAMIYDGAARLYEELAVQFGGEVLGAGLARLAAFCRRGD
jgi:3-hydroxyisobutyrate dehydrogenase-like beta-hydroxyacid dehydrogenase